MAETGTKDPREDLTLIKRLVTNKSERISYVTGVAGAANNLIWRQFSRVRLDGVICQAVRCNRCDTVLGHRSGTPYDGSATRPSGTTALRRHVCPKTTTQTPITAMLRKTVPEGSIRSEKKTVARTLSDVCAEDLRPFKFVEGKQMLLTLTVLAYTYAHS